MCNHLYPVPPAMLQEAIDKAEGEGAAKEEKGELEELKQLLPEIKEKIEDAKESQRTAAAASEAIHQTLVSCFIHIVPLILLIHFTICDDLLGMLLVHKNGIQVECLEFVCFTGRGIHIICISH